MMASGTWATHEIPILEAIADRSTSRGGPRFEDIIEATGLQAPEAQLSLRRLYDAGYIDGQDVSGFGDAGFEMLDIRLLEPALRVVGIWPREPYDELLAVLERRIADESDEVRRGKLERLRDAIGSVGQGVATSVITEVVKRSVGL
jgi:hypothetical protein